jgi:hypothetical protein
MSNPGCCTLSQIYGKLIKKWFKDNPSIIRGLYKANNDLDGILFANKEERQIKIDRMEIEKEKLLKSMTVDQKIEYLRKKQLF